MGKILYSTYTCCAIVTLLLHTHILQAQEVTDPLDNIPTSVAHGLEFLAPEGRFSIRLEGRSLSYDKRYDDQGNIHELGEPLDQVNLDASIFLPLAPFGAGATLGLTHFDTEVTAQRYEISIGYGINQNITIGAMIPFGRISTHANFSVTGGNVGFNPAYDPTLPTGGANVPLLPVGGGVTSLGTAGVQALLSDPAYGYGYKPIATSTWSGLADPTIGIIWRAYRTKRSSLILSTGLRLGLAQEVDPDDLLAVPLSDGTTDLRLRLEYYYDLGNNFDFKFQVEHDIQFKDHITKRVPQTGQLLAPSNSKERLSRDKGDYWEYDLGIGKVIGNWRAGLTWQLYRKEADKYTSSLGTNTSALEANTPHDVQQWKADLSWSGIEAWKQGDLPLPLIVQLTGQETYKARNFPKIHTVFLQITSFF